MFLDLRRDLVYFDFVFWGNFFGIFLSFMWVFGFIGVVRVIFWGVFRVLLFLFLRLLGYLW